MGTLYILFQTHGKTASTPAYEATDAFLRQAPSRSSGKRLENRADVAEFRARAPSYPIGVTFIRLSRNPSRDLLNSGSISTS
jgi:hypothetical protein